MSLKTLVDRRLLVLWLGLGFIGCTLLMSELGCGQVVAVMSAQPHATPDLETQESGFAASAVDAANGVSIQGTVVPGRDTPAANGLSCAGLLAITPQGTLLTADLSTVSSGSDTPKPVQAPTVWKRDRRRPTFARVYVGDGNSLELVSLHVSVTIDGPRARTTVDHIFRNPHDKQLEGTFEYPLPTGASPSYFAMFLGQTRDTPPPRFSPKSKITDNELAKLKPEQFVKNVDSADWGKLQEARVVSKDKALETYEDVVRGKIDPALLEYAGGNTFSGRVFPIPAKGYNRVIISYEETLPGSGDEMIYRFPMPDCKLSAIGLKQGRA